MDQPDAGSVLLSGQEITSLSEKELAALRLTPKDDPAAYAASVEGRVAALARVQTRRGDLRRVDPAAVFDAVARRLQPTADPAGASRSRRA